MAKKLGKAIKIREGTQLIACIGDEDTVSGFLLTGIGERNPRGETNFLIVDQNTPKDEIEEAFKRFVSRQDIAIILVNQHIAEKDIRHLIEAHTEVIPTVLEIPSKDFPYQPDKDMVLQRAAKMLFGNDTSKISQYIKTEEDF